MTAFMVMVMAVVGMVMAVVVMVMMPFTMLCFSRVVDDAHPDCWDAKAALPRASSAGCPPTLQQDPLLSQRFLVLPIPFKKLPSKLLRKHVLSFERRPVCLRLEPFLLEPCLVPPTSRGVNGAEFWL